ncbi:MAG: DHHA1 domain-containing protein [Pseudomonadota bacterium]
MEIDDVITECPAEYRERVECPTTRGAAEQVGLHAVAARILARRIPHLTGPVSGWLTPSLRDLPDPATLPDAERAAVRIAAAIRQKQSVALCTDYDVDGITAHTVLRDALIHVFGHAAERVSPFIGHRLRDGYGLTDPVCGRIINHKPDLVITADCGTSDAPRIERLAAAGIDVIVTDHHSVPAGGVPDAALATVNPSRHDSAFADPAIAGCAVVWFLMAQVRRVLIANGDLPASAPKLAASLDLVALGTVADAVSLFSPTNRVLVLSGLKMMNAGRRPCWRALSAHLGRDRFDVDDLGFQIGPRINARGRVADPLAALRFLTASDDGAAAAALAQLDEDNTSRKEIERRMVSVAREQAQATLTNASPFVCVYDDSFHPGVQGIVASRLMDRFGRVTAVLSPSAGGDTLSGSLRSVDGVDIGEALREVARRHPDLLLRHGGHPMAAGVTLRPANRARFVTALDAVVREQLGERRLSPVFWHDGELAPADRSVTTVDALATLVPFGRGFEAPQFFGGFEVAAARAVGAEPVHLSLELRASSETLRAIWFRALDTPQSDWPVQVGESVECIYRLQRDGYRGGDRIQLIVEHARRAGAS